jgi:hypothetical protein
MKEIEKIIYARPDEEDDFWREVVAAIKGVENLVAPHLGRLCG